MDDESIIALFFERSEQAIKELSQKYGKLMHSVAMNALGSYPDAEECVNDAYLGLWNAIPPARPKPLAAFACRIVRNISINRYHSKAFEHRRNGYEECLDEFENLFGSRESVEEEMDERLLAGYIDEFLETRSELDRLIFVRRFFYMDTSPQIAEQTGLTSVAVRSRLSRIKADLKPFLHEKGVLV